MRPHWCLPWDVGHEATLPWDARRSTMLVSFACWPLEAAAGFAVTGSCLQSLSTTGSSAQQAQHRHGGRRRPGSILPCLSFQSILPCLSFRSILPYLHGKESNRLGRGPRMGEGSLSHSLKKQGGLLIYQCPGVFL